MNHLCYESSGAQVSKPLVGICGRAPIMFYELQLIFGQNHAMIESSQGSYKSQVEGTS